MADLRWELVSPRCAVLYRISRMKKAEAVAFITCKSSAHLSRLMAAAELTLTPDTSEEKVDD